MSSNYHGSSMSTLLDTKAPVIVNNVLYNEDAVVATWINEQFNIPGVDLVSVPFVAMGIVDPDSSSTSLRERLIAGCYFFNHVDKPTRKDIWVTAAMTDAAASHRAAIKQILHYPFGELGLRRISAECDMANTRLMRQLEILGFAFEGHKPNVGPSEWGYFGLYPERCPFWND